MAAQNLYAKAVALNRDRHQNLKIELQPDHFSVAAKTNSVLLGCGEFAEALRDYPIIFVGKDGGPFSCAALVGLNDSENLLVGSNGSWEPGAYIPAFIRRYPFVLSGEDDAESFTVCVDEAYGGLTEERGQGLFNENGTESDYLKGVMEFLSLFHQEMKLTGVFAMKMAELKLLVPKVVTVERDGQRKTLDGFWVVDTQHLDALSDEKTLELVRSGYMGLIYAHLLSLKNVTRLAGRIDARSRQDGAVAQEAGADPSKESPATV